MTQTYYSPFFPDPGLGSGTKGTTVPIITPEQVVDIIDRVDDLEAGGGVDTTPPAAVTGLALSSGVVIDTDGSQIVTLVATWTAVADLDVNMYELQIQEAGGVFIPFMTGKDAVEYRWTVRANRLFGVRILAIDKSGNRGTVSATVSTTSARDTTPPASVNSPGLVSGMNSIYLSWTNPADADLDRVEIYENTVNNSGTATRIATVNAAPSQQGAFSRTGVATGGTRYYWMRAVDTSDNVSVFSTVVSGATASINPGDFATGIAPIESVAALPSTGNFRGRTVMLQSDGKIYRWNSTLTTGTANWTSETAAADITGSITSAQIADLAAAKITGQITGTQITDNAITTPKISAGAVITAKLAAGAVTTEKLYVTGSGNAINQDPNTQDITAWQLGGSVYTIVVDPLSPTGTALQAVGTSGSAGTFYSNRVPVDRTRNYQARIFVKQQSGTAPCYLTVIFYDANGAQITSGTTPAVGSGWPSTGTFNYFGLVNAAPPSTYTEYTISFGPNETAQMPTNAVFVSIGALPTYGVTGTQRFTGMKIIEKSKGELIVDGTITANKILAGSITTNEIAANTLTAYNIKTGSITTNTMLISGDNLIPNSDFATGDWTGYNAYSNWPSQFVIPRGTAGVPAGAPTIYVASFSYAGGAAHIATFTHTRAYNAVGSSQDGISVQAGEQYFASIDVAKSVAYASGGVSFYVYFLLADGGLPGVGITSTITPTGTWTTYSGEFTVPANAVRAWLYVISNSQTNGEVFWTNVRCWRKSSGNLIVNGAITADKLAANSVTATNIVGGTITGDKFNTGTSLPGTITVGSTGVAIGTIQTKVWDGLVYSDTRAVNSPPSYYRAKGTGNYAEFKESAVIGLPTGGPYAKLVTEVHHGHISGGPVYQYAQGADGRNWNRYSTDESTWGAWRDEAAQINAGTTQILPGLINISGATTLANWRQGGDDTKIAGGSISANTISANKLQVGNRNLQFRDIVFSFNAALTTLSWTAGYIFYQNDSGATTYNVIPAGSATPGASAYVYIYWTKPALANQYEGFSTPLSAGSSHYDGLGADSIQLANWIQGTRTLVQNFGGTIIDGGNITTGTITANKMSVSTLSAITANIGLLRTASSGARMELESNVIRSYDSAGTLRWRAGVWA